MSKKIRTLIVDDSVTIRKVLQHLLKSDSRFDEVYEAANAEEAHRILITGNVDLVTMDLHLPKKSGADLIREYMQIKPVPTVVISSLRPEESDLVLQSLENGAVDYIQKPSRENLLTMKSEILERLFVASQVKPGVLAAKLRAAITLPKAENSVLLIGASTGGTEAIKVFLSQLGNEIPPTLIVQHIPQFFSEAFASRLNRLFPFEVKEAETGDIIKRNRVLIAPGGKQMKMAKAGKDFVVVIEDSAPVNRHKPSVDFLFDSVVKEFNGPIIAALLTGMGADGADGLVRLRKAGAYTIAQDESTCIVFGMPKEAIKRGGVVEVCGLHQMGSAVHNGIRLLLKKSGGG